MNTTILPANLLVGCGAYLNKSMRDGELDRCTNKNLCEVMSKTYIITDLITEKDEK